MKRLGSVFLIATMMMSVFVVSSVSTAAASNSETVAVTRVGMEKNGYVNVSWRALSYCKYYRVFYKINNTGWVKASDVYYASQGNYYPGQVMSKRISVPLSKISSGNANTNVKIYVTVRGMDRDLKYNTSFRSYQACSAQLQAFAPHMYLNSVESARAIFTIIDPPNCNNSTKFRVFYRTGNSWKPIGDYYKNNLRNKCAVVTLNVPLYRVNNAVNWQLTGRELMTPDEVRMLDNKYALLFIRGERPVIDLKYDILKHPNIALTTDGEGKPYVHGKHRYNYASIQFDRDLLGGNFEETKFDDDNSDYVILTEEDIENFLNPKSEKQNKKTEVIYYDEDEEFDASSNKQFKARRMRKG